MNNRLPQNTTCFYSYKGGTGRTAILAKISHELIRRSKRRVACIDFDIEAPGFEVFFENEIIASSILQAFLDEDFYPLKMEMTKDLCAVSTKAYKIDAGMIKQFQEEFLQDFGASLFSKRIRDLSAEVLTPNQYRELLIDNRSGYPTRAEYSFQFANNIIFVFRPDIQNLLIIKNRFKRYIEELKNRKGELKIAVILNIIPNIGGEKEKRIKDFIVNSELEELIKKEEIALFEIPLLEEAFFDEKKFLNFEHPTFSEITDFITN